MRLRFRRPRYADVAATVALVFALSGTAYAVTTLPRNSVGTRSIQNGAVTNPKIAANTIQTNRIKNGTVTGVDVANGSIGNADLGVDSVQASQIADNTIDGGEIIDNSLTGNDIATGAIGNSELAPNSVTGANVAANSIGLADLVGANVSGAISFNLGANTCGTLNFGVSGAAVGEAVIMSYTGNVTFPAGVMFGPFRVVSTGNITTRACNVTTSSVSVSGIGVRFVTFG